MFGDGRVQKYLNIFKAGVVLLNIFVFIFTSIFTVLTISNSWGNRVLSYSLLVCFLVNLFLFVIISVIKNKKKKNDELRNMINMLNITRKIVNLGSVVISLIITFTMYNDAISLVMKVIMSYLSFSIAVMYILMQYFIIVLREKKNKFIDKVKKIRRRENERTIKN